MKNISVAAFGIAFLLLALTTLDVVGQGSSDVEKKKALIHEFRKLTGADTVNLGIDITLDGAKGDFAAMVEQAEGISAEKKKALQAAVADAGQRLEAELRSFLDDRSKFTEAAEGTIFEMYDKAFSEQELRDIIAFYRTDIGQRSLRFLRNQNNEFQSVFREKVRPIVSDFILPKIKAESDQLEQKIREARKKDE